MKTRYFILLISIALIAFLSGCAEKNSNNADESYRMWSGENPGKEVKVIHGKYWQSAHFTREYIVYLKLVATPAWKKEFIKQNDLINTTDHHDLPTDAPDWFNPPKKSKLWIQRNNVGSSYFEDHGTDSFFIYEEQL